ncbi:MAG: glycosyltransferase [Sphaerochaetaceae bacterium]|nr:glycosyltransferase [Sphaerochaetaceae bacterium]
MINKDPVRILMVSFNMDRCGAETFVMNFYRAIDRTKVQFDFLLHCSYKSDYEDEIESMGGRIYKIQPYKIYNKKAYDRELDEFFNKHPEYKIIHGHLYNRIEYLAVAKKHGLITISHSHSTSNGKGPKAWLLTYLHRHINSVTDYRFACSEESGKWLYKEKDYKVVRNAIDTNLFKYSTYERNKIRKEFNINKNTVVFGHVGRFLPVKQHSILLKIFSEYHKGNPDSKLLLVGDGPLFKETGKKTEALNINDSVIFAGSRPDVNSLLCAMDLFVFPSEHEGLPVTLVEAQSTGLPCVVPSHITEEVHVTDLMRKVEGFDPKEWAEECQKALNDFSSYKREEALEAVKASGFDIQETAQELQNFYLEINK